MSDAIKDFKDLRVWQAAMTLAEHTYRMAARLPADERFGLALQLRRCAVSVPSNIAEGWGRRTRGDYVRFLRVANASLKELETQVLLAGRMRLIEEDLVGSALDLIGQTARLLTALLKKLVS